MTPQDNKGDRKITRPMVPDLDGTQQGGLAFCVSVIGGAVLAGLGGARGTHVVLGLVHFADVFDGDCLGNAEAFCNRDKGK